MLVSHKEYVRLVPNARCAVLMIHGICGTPDHFRDLIPLEALVPENVSLCNILLDGHGGTVSDFARTSGKKWRKQVFSAFDQLTQDHEKIYIVGHSMGTLFALQLAAAYPEQIGGLFLLAVPMRPWVHPSMVPALLRLVFGKLDSVPPERAALAKAAGIRTTRKLWKYIPWIPRFLDLFTEIHRTEQILEQVDTECICFQSRKDELVWKRSEQVLERNGRISVRKLMESSHFYYAEADKLLILQEFKELIHEITHD